MKYPTKLFIIASLCFLVACNKSDDIKIGQEFDLSFEQTLTFNEGDFDIQLTGVQDSRCPLEVLCVLPGEALVTFQILNNDLGDTFELTTNLNSNENANIHILDNHRIELISLTPYPENTNPIPEEKYIATLKITEL